MNSEEERLRTFSSSAWPLNAPVYPQQLASCGFFATGQFLEAKCHWCNCCISDWEYGDEVEQRHQRAMPLCEFLVNNVNCGNIRIQSSRESDPGDLMNEANRLATFKNWPNPNISPASLAKAGFYYLNRSDEVKCAWCKGMIAQWEKQDNAFEEHKRFFPDCPRVQLGPLIEITSDGIRDLGIQHLSPPKNPKFSSLDARLRTYTNWPIPDVQKPDALAQAGLYYQEVDDQVRCFHCNMGLRSWEKEDDPWFEHAKWYPMCQFVRLVKGVNYIQQVQELTKRASSSHSPIIPSVGIDEAMSTSPVKIALEIGLDAGAVRNKTLQQILRTGNPYTTAEELIKAVLDEQDFTPDEDIMGAIPATFSNECAGFSNITEAILNNGPNSIIPQQDVDTTASSCDRSIREDAVPREKSGEALQTKCEDSASLDSASKDIPNKDHLSLEEENRKLKDARLCKVCLSEEVGVVYLPCGHLVTCVQCAPGVNQCPMCRTTIKGFVRTFLS